MDDLTKRETHFEFGKNWSDFSRSISDQSIAAAVEGVRKLVPDIAGKSFLDIGCGSGLSSLAALKLGAREVLATDIDENSVETTRRLLNASGQDRWSARQTSVFDLNSSEHGTFDVVYSWGVLHHTGDMWRAIERSASMVSPGGNLVIAIYRKTPMCGAWSKIKRFYTSASAPSQNAVRALYKAAFVGGLIATRRNPINYIRDYKSKRGMSWSHDVHDWIGGYPYESASASEITKRLERMNYSIVTTNLTSPGLGVFGTGCDEFVARNLTQ